MKTLSIEIQFPFEVELPPGFQFALDALVNMVCKKYEAEHPGRTMWVSGGGFKPLFNPYTISDNEEMKFDETVLFLECSEKEKAPKKPRTTEIEGDSHPFYVGLRRDRPKDPTI